MPDLRFVEMCIRDSLSGGLDSSILCALAAKRGPLTTYSLDYEGNAQYFKGYAYQTTRDNEYIDAMIERYAFDHHPLVIAQRECAELLEPAMIGRDGPGMADVDSSLLWMYGKVREQNLSLIHICTAPRKNKQSRRIWAVCGSWMKTALPKCSTTS